MASELFGESIPLSEEADEVVVLISLSAAKVMKGNFVANDKDWLKKVATIIRLSNSEFFIMEANNCCKATPKLTTPMNRAVPMMARGVRTRKSTKWKRFSNLKELRRGKIVFLNIARGIPEEGIVVDVDVLPWEVEVGLRRKCFHWSRDVKSCPLEQNSMSTEQK